MESLYGVAISLMAVGGVFVLVNWLSVIQTWITGRFCSAIPLFGALLMGSGMLLIPSTRPYAWLAIFVDYGTLALIPALPHIVQELRSTSLFNLLEEYEGRERHRTVRLRLFRSGKFTLEQQFRGVQQGLTGMSTLGTWSYVEDHLQMVIGDSSATFETKNDARGEALLQATGFHCYENSGLSLEGITLKLKYRRKGNRGVREEDC